MVEKETEGRLLEIGACEKTVEDKILGSKTCEVDIKGT